MAVVAYLDCSGDAKDPSCRVLGVCGFIAHESQWAHFEREWAAVLREFGVSALHMKEFAHGVKGSEFETWKGDEPRRSLFLSALANVITFNTIQNVSITMLLGAYRACNAEFRLKESLGSPYSLSSLVAFSRIHSWHDSTDSEEPLIVIFESGDNEQSDFRKVIGSMDWSDSHITLPVFQPKKWPNKKTGAMEYCLPMQAADFYAWESAKAVSEYFSPKRKNIVRESLFAIDYPPKSDRLKRVIPLEMLKSLMKDYNVSPRFNRSDTAQEHRLPAEPLCYLNMDLPLVSTVGVADQLPLPQRRPKQRRENRP